MIKEKKPLKILWIVGKIILISIGCVFGFIILLGLIGFGLCKLLNPPQPEMKTFSLINNSDQYLTVKDKYEVFGEIAPGVELVFRSVKYLHSWHSYSIDVVNSRGETIYSQKFIEPVGQKIISLPGESLIYRPLSNNELSYLRIDNKTNKYLCIFMDDRQYGAIKNNMQLVAAYPQGQQSTIIEIKSGPELVYSRVLTAEELNNDDVDIEIKDLYITNALGATNVAENSATLNGNLISDGGPDTNVRIFWGTKPGDDDTRAWEHQEDLGIVKEGAFSENVTGLIPGKLYYYRCYASTPYSSKWASGATSFFAH